MTPGEFGSTPASGNKTPSKHKKIALIDDSPIVLQMAEKALVRAGYFVKAIQYPDGLTKPLTMMLLEFTPDLILCDVDMPLLRGDQFAKVAKSSKLLQNVKLYFYSSQPVEELMTCVQETAANGYIEKTNDTKGLVCRVQEILG